MKNSDPRSLRTTILPRSRLVSGTLLLLLVPALCLTAACASAGGMRDEPLNAGASRVYDAPFGQVMDAARESVVEADFKIEDAYQADDETWVIVAKKGTNVWSWGELVRLVISKTDDGKSMVRVMTKRRASFNVTAKGDWSQSLFSSIELKLQTARASASGSS